MSETTVGRQPITIVEVRQPSCALTYGTSPCTAQLGVTGTRKCMNGTVTCQDRENLDLSDTIVWRFAKPAANLPKDLYEEVVGSPGTEFKTNLIPSLVSVSTSPTKINIGGGSQNESPFGRRSSVSITLQDHPWDDSVGDKYRLERITGEAIQHDVVDTGTARAVSALHFDNSLGQSLHVAHDASLDFGTDSFSVEYWVSTSDAAADLRELVSKEIGGQGWRAGLLNGKLNAFVGDASGFKEFDLGQTNVADGAAHLIGFRFDRTAGVVVGFVDGVRESTPGDISANIGDYDTLADLIVRAHFEATGQVTVDGLRVYARGLTDAEFAEHYQGVFKDKSNVAGHWEFDEGTGTTAFDSSGNGNDGTLVNGPTWVDDIAAPERKIRLAEPGSPAPNIEPGQTVRILSGTGAGQKRAITSFDETTRIAKVDRKWFTAPDDTSEYDVVAEDLSYDPFTRGTFWAKWLARNPFYTGYQVKVYDGYVGQDISEMSSRLYLLDKIDGPDSNGRVRITAKDPLKLADDKRAQAPRATQAELRDAIDDSQTTGIVVVAAQEDLTEQLGNTAEHYIRFGDEILSYTGVSGADTEWELTGVTRSVLGTEVEEHDSGDHCQRVLRYESMKVWLIAHDLLENFTEGAADFVDLDGWNEEGDTWLPTFQFTGTVPEPTPVNELIAELTESGLFYVWWDERAQVIPMKAIRPVTETPMMLNDRDHILENSLSLKVDPDQRISQVWVYFNQRNPTEDLEEVGNYSNVRVRIDAQAELPEEYGQSRVRKVFSRWITSDAMASQVAFRLLARYRDNPRYLSLRLDAKDRSLWTADVADITHYSLTDDTGAPETGRWQVISAEEVQPGEVVAYDLQTFEFLSRYGFYMADDAPDYTDATDDEKNQGGWYADQDGLVAGDEGYRYI